jgi:hypothetical protein
MQIGLSADPTKNALYPGVGFFAEFEHDALNLRDGTLVAYKRAGFPISTADEAREPGWGLSPKSTDLDERNQYTSPFSSSETVRMFDVQRCVDVSAALITPTVGVAYELAHLRTPAGSVLIIEDLPTIFESVEALDNGGVPFHSYGSLNGESLCLNELVHPDPLVTVPLTWRFHLTWSDDPSSNAPSNQPDMTYLGPILPLEIFGQHITPPWRDCRMGGQNVWAERKQFLAPASCVVRYWVELRGPTNAFQVRVGARIGGFLQLGGRKGSALASVLTRRV